MEDLPFLIIEMISGASFGYIVYRPKTTRIKQAIHYNHEALQILSFSGLSPEKETGSSSALSNLCEKWENILKKRLEEARKSGKKDPLTGSFIELVQSGKRNYVVRGVVLYDHVHSSKG